MGGTKASASQRYRHYLVTMWKPVEWAENYFHSTAVHFRDSFGFHNSKANQSAAAWMAAVLKGVFKLIFQLSVAIVAVLILIAITLFLACLVICLILASIIAIRALYRSLSTLRASLPSSRRGGFEDDSAIGLSSETFDLSHNIENQDQRSGLNTYARTMIWLMMHWHGVDFDNAREMYVKRQFRRNNIALDGRPRDPKAIFYD